MAAPRILVTLDAGEQPRRDVAFAAWLCKRAYVDAVVRAGGLPLLVAPGADPEALADSGDGLVVTGGAADLDPDWSGADPSGRIDPPHPERAGFERSLLRVMRARGRPVLAVCGGMQLLVVDGGGRLVGDIRTELSTFGEHEQPTSPTTPWHDVELDPDGWLARAIGRSRIRVNSTHHQGALEAPDGLRVLGRSLDGMVEAVDDGTSTCVGVQWHPELLDDEVSRALYANLVDRARSRA